MACNKCQERLNKKVEQGQKERKAGKETEIEVSESGALISKVLLRGFRNENKSPCSGPANFLATFVVSR